MPGCAAPSCSRHSRNGFRLFVFPRDPEKRNIWVQNCRRDCWKPTNYSRLCEVHFEDSQFESHRADGFRKLKPNAIPTIFTNVTPLQSNTRKQKKKLKIENADSTTVKCEDICEHLADSKSLRTSGQKKSLRSIAENGDSFIQKEVEGLKQGSVTKASVSGRKRCLPSSEHEKKDVICDVSLDKSKSDQVKKHNRHPNSVNKIQHLSSLSIQKSPKVPVMNKERLQETDKGMAEGDCPTSGVENTDLDNGEKNQCFVCGKTVKTGVALHTMTNTTKVYLHQKLNKIITGEMELLIDEEGILCTKCSTLLNYMDRIEVELSMLTIVILNCIRKKYGMAAKPTHNGSVNLLPNIESVPESTGKFE